MVFKRLRIQILYPCNARCVWCSTHHKNPIFRELYDGGIADRIHHFYVQAIRRLRPQQVFISGGEPLLYPGIADFLNAIQTNTEEINLFTSFQFSAKLRENIPFQEMPLRKIVLCHTPIYFEPERWHEQTQGFPFDLYVKNIQAIARIPVRKKFKFILNHPELDQELEHFQKLVEPDKRFEFSLKVINDQGDGINEATIRQSQPLINERIQSLENQIKGAGWGKINYKVGTLHEMAPLLQDGDVNRCLYRQEPIELRLAFYRATKEKHILKYRYCPYFPANFGHRFHVGRDDLEKLERNYFKGNFREYCDGCRFLKYCRVAENAAA